MKTTLALALLALASCALSAKAQTLIYLDTFQYGTGYPGISGQQPTIYDTGNARWTGNGGYLFTNGDNSALQTASGDAVAYLPLALTTNTSYSYSLTLNPTSNNSWQEMGFINTATATSGESALVSTNLGPSLIFGPGAGPGDGTSGIQLFNGHPGLNPVSVSTPADAAANNPQTLTFVLNTGDTLGTYNYSVTDTDSNGDTFTLASNVTYTGTISGIQLGTFYESGYMSNLVVTSTPIAAPEPSTTCLILAGALGLFALQRRVRAS